MVPPIIPPDDPGDHGKSAAGGGPAANVNVLNFPASQEISNDAGNPVPVSGPLTDVELRATPVPVSGTITAQPPVAVERKFDGDDISGAGSIVIPAGVISFAATVQTLGAGVSIDGPDGSPVALFAGQSIGHSADANNTISGPITITTTLGSIVNATWLYP